jgi:prevent-host-death family protein
MDTIGLRELRQDASTFVRRVQEGESFTVTVQGRPAAQLVPVRPTPERRRWMRYDDVADILDHRPLSGLAEDLASVDHSVRDPFEDRTPGEQSFNA